jgi:hypothetical protein
MDVREVRGIHEIVETTQRICVVRIRAGLDLAEVSIIPVRQSRDIKHRLAKTDPDEAVSLGCAIPLDDAARRRLVVGMSRHVHALAAAIEMPPVIWTHDPAVLHLAKRQRCAAMGAEILPGLDLAVLRPPQDYLVAQQPGSHRRISGDILRARNHMPLIHQRQVVQRLAVPVTLVNSAET